jgi:hypothetical protein
VELSGFQFDIDLRSESWIVVGHPAGRRVFHPVTLVGPV